MNRTMLFRTFAATLVLCMAADATAQQQPGAGGFPAARDRPASCDSFDWSERMLSEYPRVVDACQEVVLVGDKAFARLSARFVRVRPDGQVSFNVRDRQGRYVDQLTIQPAEGQMAYINDRETAFRNLRTTDAISLYAAEGEYGFASQPFAASEQRAAVRTVAALPEPLPADEVRYDRDTATARLDPVARALPQTAGSLPLVALAGLLSLFAGLGLAAGRRM